MSKKEQLESVLSDLQSRLDGSPVGAFLVDDHIVVRPRYCPPESGLEPFFTVRPDGTRFLVCGVAMNYTVTSHPRSFSELVQTVQPNVWAEVQRRLPELDGAWRRRLLRERIRSGLSRRGEGEVLRLDAPLRFECEETDNRRTFLIYLDGHVVDFVAHDPEADPRKDYPLEDELEEALLSAFVEAIEGV